VPECTGKQCGSDGCGGTCGSCESGTSCTDGTCAWPQRSFAEHVFPILQASGCDDNGCHGEMRPAEDLELSSASIAYDELVGVASNQCSDRLLVEPGAPLSSYLVHKITGEQLCSGSKMPKAGSGLSAPEIDTLRAWIGSGAAP
jgi:hypothetical protein